MGRGRDRPRQFELTPPGPEHITLTAQEACKAELEGAVDLIGRFDNLAAAHLIAAAATELIRKRAKKLKVKLEHDFVERIQIFDEQTRAHIKYAMNHSYNSLKHSDGADGVHVYFRREFVQYHLLMAIELYMKLFDEMTPKLAVYRTWALVNAAQVSDDVRAQLEAAGTDLSKLSPDPRTLRLALEGIDENPREAEAAVKVAMIRARRGPGPKVPAVERG